MSTWNDLRSVFGRAANGAIQKTGEFADVTAMRLKLKVLEGKRDDQYRVLGKLTYRQLKTGVSQAEKIAVAIESLDDIRGKIRRLTDEIDQLKAEREEKIDDTMDDLSEDMMDSTSEDEGE